MMLTAPAAAAAFWDWEHGRFDVEDLYLWVSARALHWSRGLPGRDLAGSVPRKGPLHESLRPALSRAQADRNPVVLFVEGDAPGGEILEEMIRKAGHTIRPLSRPPEEMGVDPAAAGAALARLTDSFGALHTPHHLDHTLGWRRKIGAWILVALAVGWASSALQEARFRDWLEAEQQQAEEALPSPGNLQQTAAAPVRWTDLAQRRKAVLAALEGGEDDPRLQSLRIVTDVRSPEIRVEQEPVSE